MPLLISGAHHWRQFAQLLRQVCPLRELSMSEDYKRRKACASRVQQPVLHVSSGAGVWTFLHGLWQTVIRLYFVYAAVF